MVAPINYVELLKKLKDQYSQDTSRISPPTAEELGRARNAETVSSLMNNLFQAQAKVGNIGGEVKDPGANFDFYGKAARTGVEDASKLAAQKKQEALGNYELGVGDIYSQQQALASQQALANAQQQAGINRNQKALSDINLQRAKSSMSPNAEADRARYIDLQRQYNTLQNSGDTFSLTSIRQEMDKLTKAYKLEEAAKIAEKSGDLGRAEKLRESALKIKPVYSQENVLNLRNLDAPSIAIPKQAPLSTQDKTDLSNAKEVKYRFDALKQNAEKLKDIIKREGTVALTGTAGQEMDSKIYQMAVDFSKLVDPESVAREGEVAAAKKYMLDFRNLGGFTTRNSTAISSIDKYIEDLQDRLKARQATYGNIGQNVLNTPSVEAGRFQSIRPAGKVKVSNGSEVFEIDESDLKEAQKDGYEVVQ